MFDYMCFLCRLSFWGRPEDTIESSLTLREAFNMHCNCTLQNFETNVAMPCYEVNFLQFCSLCS